MDPNLLKGNLDLILLSILGGGEMYGLEIIDEAQARTDGYFSFKEGSVYPALHRLTQAGLLEAEFRPSPRGGMPCRYYRLTEKGRVALETKRREFSRFAGAVEALWDAE